MDPFFLLLLLLMMVLLFWLPMRRQRAQVKQVQQLQSSLQIGDRVMTTSGLQATIVDAADGTVDLEIAPGVVTTWLRQAIRERLTDEADETEPDTDEDIEDTPERTTGPANDEADRRSGHG